jgi:hypothetical protein
LLRNPDDLLLFIGQEPPKDLKATNGGDGAVPNP